MGCGHWTDVFEVLDIHPSAVPQITSLSDENYQLALSDIEGFFEVAMTMTCTPDKAYRRFGKEITGLCDLQKFLMDRHPTVSVRWNYTKFTVHRNEFGVIVIHCFQMLCHH